jgi:hypothetical protein
VATVREILPRRGPASASVPAIWAYRGAVAALPPDDAESWSDEQWLAWLEDVDAESSPEPAGHPARPARSLPAAMMGAAMLGMHRVIYGDTEPVIQMVIEADGDPQPPERLEIHLDQEDPDASTVTVRPWLDGEEAT